MKNTNLIKVLIGLGAFLIGFLSAIAVSNTSKTEFADKKKMLTTIFQNETPDSADVLEAVRNRLLVDQVYLLREISRCNNINELAFVSMLGSQAHTIIDELYRCAEEEEYIDIVPIDTLIAWNNNKEHYTSWNKNYFNYLNDMSNKGYTSKYALVWRVKVLDDFTGDELPIYGNYYSALPINADFENRIKSLIEK